MKRCIFCGTDYHDDCAGCKRCKEYKGLEEVGEDGLTVFERMGPGKCDNCGGSQGKRPVEDSGAVYCKVCWNNL